MCAQGYEKADGGCVQSCSGTTPKWDGTKCVSATANCASNYKDNGLGQCIPSSQPCPPPFIDNGAGKCAETCATGFTNNGLGICVNSSQNSSALCSPGFVISNGTCVIPTASNLLTLLTIDPTLKCDPLCLVCNSAGLCSLCKVGYALTTTGNCVPCVNCQTCLPTDPQKCLSCFAPLVLSQENRTCQTINCTVSNCTQCDISGRCVSCLEGYAFQNGTCVACKV